MNRNIKSVLALMLAMLFVLSCFVACADISESDETSAATDSGKTDGTTGDKTDGTTDSKPNDKTDGTTDGTTDDKTDGTTADIDDGTQAPDEEETKSDEDIKKDAIAETKEELGKIDFGKKTLAILTGSSFKGETFAEEGVVDADGGSSQLLNDAVLARNKRMEEECNLTFESLVVADGEMVGKINTESMSPTGDFQFINYRISEAAHQALAGRLHDWVSMGIDLDKPWWDTGTADFALLGKVFFMCGDVNYTDDNTTYVLIFNKQMQAQYSETVPNPYQTVKDWEWTLEYFNNIIQGISSESSGDGTWDENDTYGFVTTWEYGNTFFIGSDLRYIKNDRTMERPELALDSMMDKALLVLDLAKAIFNENNATYMSPPGEEAKGLACFKAGRAMFYSEVASYLPKLNKDMDAEFGILPVPKYDKAQEFYRTWTFGSGGCLSLISSIPDADAETIGKLVQYYGILSTEEVKPVFYDVMLTTQSVRDDESGEMLDLIFANRVYDMGLYFDSEFNLYSLFKNDVYQNTNKFSSAYKSATKKFDSKVTKLLKDLEKKTS